MYIDPYSRDTSNPYFTQSNSSSNVCMEFFYDSLQPFLDRIKSCKGQINYIKISLCNWSKCAVLVISRIFYRLFRPAPVSEAVALISSDDFLQVKKPLYLRNIGNSCYLDAVLQLLLSLKEARSKIFNKNWKNQEGDLIRSQLYHLIESKFAPVQESSWDQLFTFFDEEKAHSPVFKLRQAIFDSGLCKGEFPAEQVEMQHDALCVLELLMRVLIEEKFLIQEYCYTDQIANLIFPRQEDSSYVLNLPMNENAKTVIDLIHDHFKMISLKEKCMFNLNAGISKDFFEKIYVNDQFVKDRKDIQKTKDNLDDNHGYLNEDENDQVIKVESYESIIKLKSLPNILAIHLIRSFHDGSDKKKNSDSVEISDEFDLSEFYDRESAPNSNRYELCGYIVHIGDDVTKGHYTTNVKIDDHYFHCDNQRNDSFIEITKEDFYKCDQPYLLLYKRKKMDDSSYEIRDLLLPMNIEEPTI